MSEETSKIVPPSQRVTEEVVEEKSILQPTEVKAPENPEAVATAVDETPPKEVTIENEDPTQNLPKFPGYFNIGDAQMHVKLPFNALKGGYYTGLLEDINRSRQLANLKVLSQNENYKAITSDVIDVNDYDANEEVRDKATKAGLSREDIVKLGRVLVCYKYSNDEIESLITSATWKDMNTTIWQAVVLAVKSEAEIEEAANLGDDELEAWLRREGIGLASKAEASQLGETLANVFSLALVAFPDKKKG